MPHIHRFHVAAPPGPDHQVLLTGPEAHHALHVVRLRPGDAIELFDGAGTEWDAVVSEVTRHDVRAVARDCRESPRPAAGLTLFQAWLHRDKAVEELVRHGAEIGIERMVFFPSHHSERTPRLNEKWMRTAIEACKQCRRAWLPTFIATDSIEDALALASGTLLVATRELRPVALENALASPNVSLFVGPEGDFTESELAAFTAHGAKAISLGGATYRSEVAAILASALVLHHLGQLG